MTWSVAEAKAKFSELVNRSGEQPQVIRNRGRQVAVVLSLAEYARLAGRPTPDDQMGEMVMPEPMTIAREFRVDED